MLHRVHVIEIQLSGVPFEGGECLIDTEGVSGVRMGVHDCSCISFTVNSVRGAHTAVFPLLDLDPSDKT
jgi:hypothetical protein